MRTAIPIAAFAVALAALAARSAVAQEGQGGQAMSGVKEAGTSLSPEQPRHPRAAPATAPAPKHKPPPRRRSVQQVIAAVPPPQLAGPGYGPTLYPRAPAPAPGAAPLYPPPPAVLATCQGGVCTDAAGATYHLGPGNAGVSSQGRLCSRTGQTVQCF